MSLSQASKGILQNNVSVDLFLDSWHGLHLFILDLSEFVQELLLIAVFVFTRFL